MHEDGNEYWLQYGISPSKNSVVYVDTNANDGTFSIFGTLKYITEEKVPSKNFNCDPDSTLESFTRCAFMELKDYECSSAIDRIGKYFNETNICKNLTQLSESNKLIKEHLGSTLYSSNSTSKCIKPCKTTSFDVALDKHHENGKVLGNERVKTLATAGRFILNFKYYEFVIDAKKEFFIMNEAGLISAVGGFLGLFLGSSCVSVIEWIGQFFKKFMK